MENAQNKYERYSRQLLLPELGMAGQQKLERAAVLLIGAGGLGCPVLQYLVAAGVGRIGIVDDDMVAMHNLHRQVLYSVKDIGLPKAERAAAILREQNPGIQIIPFRERLTPANAAAILSPFDIIVDGSDNFPTRYLVNDACVLLDKPLVSGSISKFEGQLAVFNARREGEEPVNYRDLFPVPPADSEVLNCAEAGVLGVLPGIIGTMMANETIKLITGLGIPLINRLFTYNALTNHTIELELRPGTGTRTLIPPGLEELAQTDYGEFCQATSEAYEIGFDEFRVLAAMKHTTIIDVREPGEMPRLSGFPHAAIPLAKLAEQHAVIQGEIVITFCQSGTRSLQAARLLAGLFGGSKKIYSLKGGMQVWKQEMEKQPV